MSEINWKPVLDYPDYEVSDHGGLRRVVANRGCPRCRELRPQKLMNGYMKAILFRDGKGKQFCMHRLVLTAFVGPAPEGFVCNHKDGNRAHNHIDNLEWVTFGDNIRHAINVLGKRREGKLSPDQVREIRRLYPAGQYTQHQLGEMYEIDGSGISFIMTGRNYGHIK